MITLQFDPLNVDQVVAAHAVTSALAEANVPSNPPVSAPASAPSEEEEAKKRSAAAKKAAATRAAKKAAKEEPSKEEKTTEEEAPSQETSVTLNDVRAALSSKADSHTDIIKAELTKLGVKSISTMDDTLWEGFITFLNNLK
jgi:hypothetical protein